MPSWDASGNALKKALRETDSVSIPAAKKILTLAYQVFQASKRVQPESPPCGRFAGQAAVLTVLIWEDVKLTRSITPDDLIAVSNTAEKFMTALQNALDLMEEESARFSWSRRLFPDNERLSGKLKQYENQLRTAFNETTSILGAKGSSNTDRNEPSFGVRSMSPTGDPEATPRNSTDGPLHPERQETLKWTDVQLTLEVDRLDVREPFWADVAGAILAGRQGMIRRYRGDRLGRENFNQDLQFLTKTKHPNFPKIMGSSPHGTVPFIAISSLSLRQFDEFLVELCDPLTNESANSSASSTTVPPRNPGIRTIPHGEAIAQVLVMLCELLQAIEYLDKEQILSNRDALKYMLRSENLRVDQSDKLLLGTNLLRSLPDILPRMPPAECIELVKDASAQYLRSSLLQPLHCIRQAIEIDATRVLREDWAKVEEDGSIEAVLERLDSIRPAIEVQEGLMFLNGRECQWAGILRVHNLRATSGGFGDVKKGEWELPEEPVPRLVAIKQLRGSDDIGDKRLMQRFNREFQAWREADHPHVLPLLGIVTQPDPCFISPWCELGNVEGFREGKPFGKLLSLVCQLASGLVYLHGRKPPVVHGDLKANNVLILDNGDAAIADFGLARVISEIKSNNTTSGMVNQGTVQFMAPELLSNGAEDKNRESDVYSFGLVSVQILSGKEPYHKFPRRDNSIQIIRAILEGTKISRDDHPPFSDAALKELWSVFDSCWEFDPSQRPTMEAVHHMLLNIRARLPSRYVS